MNGDESLKINRFESGQVKNTNINSNGFDQFASKIANVETLFLTEKKSCGCAIIDPILYAMGKIENNVKRMTLSLNNDAINDPPQFKQLEYLEITFDMTNQDIVTNLFNLFSSNNINHVLLRHTHSKANFKYLFQEIGHRSSQFSDLTQMRLVLDSCAQTVDHLLDALWELGSICSFLPYAIDVSMSVTRSEIKKLFNQNLFIQLKIRFNLLKTTQQQILLRIRNIIENDLKEKDTNAYNILIAWMNENNEKKKMSISVWTNLALY